MEDDSKGKASEVVSMETDLQMQVNRNSAVFSDSHAVFLETAPKRSKKEAV